MKKILVLLLALCCVVGLAACSSQQGQEEKPNGQDYFNGKVLEIHDTYILVECLDVTSGAITSGTTAKVSTEIVNAHGIPEMDIGDNVRVVFTGVKEKDPVSFDTVFSIFLLDENGEVIPFDVVDTPSITGIVTKVYEHSFLMLGEPTEGYTNAEEYSVSLNVENKDSYTSVVVGDEVIVYHNGEIAESDPLQINTVYAITLKTAAAGAITNDYNSTEWLDGVTFIELAPGKETKSSTEITISNDNTILQCSITYGRAALTLEYGLQAADGTEYSREIIGGSEIGTIENIPAGTYYLFVRNSGDYSDLPAYQNKSMSYNATGAMNYAITD